MYQVHQYTGTLGASCRRAGVLLHPGCTRPYTDYVTSPLLAQSERELWQSSVTGVQ